MTEHDEPFDRKVRELIAMAQADAPEAIEADRPTRGATHGIAARVALVAAAVLLVVAGVAVLGGRGADPASTTVDSVTATTLADPSTTTVFFPVDCGRSLATPYEEVGSIHTVVPSPLTLEVRIVAPEGGCTGGDGEVSIELTNPTDLAVEVEPTSVILASGMEKWAIGRLDATTLQPGTSVTSVVPIVVPPIPPGSYFVSLYGFGSSAPFEVSGPRVCVITDLVSEVVTDDGNGLDLYQLARVTNHSDVPCVLLRPTYVTGLRFGADGVVLPLQPGAGAFGSIGAPLGDHVLDPGESADLALTTSQRCDGEREVYDMIDIHLGVGNDPDGARSVSVGRDVDVTCGLWLSQWLEP